MFLDFYPTLTVSLFHAWRFQMFLCVVVFGLFHGILLLPVLLALIGSHSEHDEEPFEDKEVFQSYLILSYLILSYLIPILSFLILFQYHLILIL